MDKKIYLVFVMVMTSICLQIKAQSKELKAVEVIAFIDKDSTTSTTQLNINFILNRPDLLERVFVVDNSHPGAVDPAHYIIPAVKNKEEYALFFKNSYFPFKEQYGGVTISTKGTDLDSLRTLLLYFQDKKGKYTERQIITINR